MSRMAFGPRRPAQNVTVTTTPVVPTCAWVTETEQRLGARNRIGGQRVGSAGAHHELPRIDQGTGADAHIGFNDGAVRAQRGEFLTLLGPSLNVSPWLPEPPARSTNGMRPTSTP